MGRILLILSILILASCTTSEKVVPVVIPEDGATTDYNEFLPRLRSLAWRATEAYYRDRWDELDDAAQSLERAVKVLKQSKNAPTRVQADLAARCDRLSAECVKLRDAAKVRSESSASERLQHIHTLIRELRTES